jgi:hypothetical protein
MLCLRGAKRKMTRLLSQCRFPLLRTASPREGLHCGFIRLSSPTSSRSPTRMRSTSRPVISAPMSSVTGLSLAAMVFDAMPTRGKTENDTLTVSVSVSRWCYRGPGGTATVAETPPASVPLPPAASNTLQVGGKLHVVARVKYSLDAMPTRGKTGKNTEDCKVLSPARGESYEYYVNIW